MWIRLLGTVSAHGPGGDELLPAGLRLRGLLARLALDAGRPVDAATLVDAVWGDRPPSTANALQSLVSRLRRALGPDRVRGVSGGYLLAAGPDEVDALRFTALRRAAATEPDDTAAGGLLTDALGLWCGPALADVRELAFAGPAADRLAEARAAAAEELAARGLAGGSPGSGLDVLTEVLAEQPLRETTAVALARGLHAGGRRADALAVLDRTRSALAEELGVDPGPELRRARTELLRDAPDRNGSAPAAPAPVPAAADGQRYRTPALTSFVGRDDDLARLHAALGRARLVTVTGPGGAGKTRMVTEAVRGLDRPVAVAELAALTGADQVATTVLHSVGGPDLALGDRGGPDTRTRLRGVLAGRDLVLVVDNCEHLVDAVADLVLDLLTAAAGLTVLATSREPLGVPGEQLLPLDALADAHAVRLFTDRARAVRPDLVLGPDELAVVVQVCRRLDGQPLPIELAAARVRTLTPAEIADRLADRFRLLVSGARTALPRHQTLRAVVDWSWDLLTPHERTVATRFGVFAGPVDADAVEAVCDPGGHDADPLAVLDALVDKSLVVASPDPAGGPTRYRMLETIREYAAGRLAESGTAAAVTRAHADWVLAVLEPGEPQLRTPAQLSRLAVVRRIEGEAVRALERATADGPAARAHRLLAALAWSWVVRGEMPTLRRWSDAVAALPEPEPDGSVALNHAVRAALLIGYPTVGEAAAEVEAVLALQQVLPPPWHPLVALAGPVSRMFTGGDRTELATIADDPARDPWLRATAAQLGAVHAENGGDLEVQRGLLRVAHRLFSTVGDRFGLGTTVASLGELEDLAGDADAAATAFAEAVALSAELGNVDDAQQFGMRLAVLAARRGDSEAAESHLRAVETAGDRAPAPDTAAWLEQSRAEIARRLGRPERARAVLAASGDATAPGPGRLQRSAGRDALAAAVEMDLGNLDAARPLLERAADTALTSADGPVLGQVGEASARWALASGDPERAGELLGVAQARRGTLHLGDPDVVAVHDAVLAALGPDGAAAALARGRATPRDHPPRPDRDAQVRRR